jgi:hypothetical protein
MAANYFVDIHIVLNINIVNYVPRGIFVARISVCLFSVLFVNFIHSIKVMQLSIEAVANVDNAEKVAMTKFARKYMLLPCQQILQ